MAVVRMGPRNRTGRFPALVALVVLAPLASACTDSAATDDPPATDAPVTVATVPATAEASPIALDAPHSGDRPVAAGCPSGGEMLDWDGDGWGDCVDPGGPPSVPTPPGSAGG